VSNDFTSVDVGGRALRYICGGSGAPTVVVDQGLGISVEHSLAKPLPLGWAKVFLEVRKFTRICMYDRAGVGNSDPVPPPRTSLDMMKDLRALVRKAEVAPPYVLVGHSIGGFNVCLYAHKYPKEVAGLVLVDSSHPDQLTRLAEVLPPYSPGEAAMLRAFRQRLDPRSSTEGLDLASSADQVRPIGTLGKLPLVVLSHSPKQPISSETPVDVAAKIEKVWSELQVDLARLSARSSHVVAAQAGHHIQLDEPQLVIDAILKVVSEARTAAPSIH
jgi:pimeloyl-ACP methyl ester carboxylesterase